MLFKSITLNNNVIMTGYEESKRVKRNALELWKREKMLNGDAIEGYPFYIKLCTRRVYTNRPWLFYNKSTAFQGVYPFRNGVRMTVKQ